MLLTTAHKMGMWILTGFLGVLTIFFNTYILLMGLRNYRQSHHWTPCETIITGLALQNVAHQVFSYFWMSMDQLDHECKYRILYAVLTVIVLSLKFSIMWTTAFLVFYYATKLVIEPIHCYTRIQEVILKHVLTVVIVIPICGFSICVPLITTITAENITWLDDCSIMPEDFVGQMYGGFCVLVSDVIPGVLIFKSSISITVHLAIHLQHMKASTNGFHTPKLGSEMRVIRMNLFLVVIFLSFLIVDIYSHYVILMKDENLLSLTVLFSSMYTSLCALVLIYGKKTFWKNLLHLYNLFLDDYPCLGCLKVPETKRVHNQAPHH
ncbi:taste receptor, type 2, member 202 [Denticeps clupeoides]|uniref:Taste receptor type 2 n=1 Tax=Denticeps clupeoides TaxID=299321 RepID=A0AAY4EDR6_9TELE|nr:uncharacterized protein LOC114799951 [Denticeps clupeoides]XP_028852779.1 uncharacterized protein LOC114799951 [Denticeps clupeoides]